MSWEKIRELFSKINPKSIYKLYNSLTGKYSDETFPTRLQAKAYMRRYGLNRKTFEIRRVESKVIW